MATAQPGFLRRLAIAGVNLLTPLHAGLVVAYFALRWLGKGDLWFVDAIAYVLPWLFLPLIVLLPAILLRRSRSLLTLAAIPAVLFLLTYGHLYLPRWPVRTTGPVFTAMTYNILYRNQDANGIAAEIEALDPDFFGLRELEPPVAQVIETQFAASYPYYKVEPGCGFWSRYPILEYEAFQLVPGEGDWAQQLVLDMDGTPLNVLSVHPRSPPVYGVPLSELWGRLPTALNDEGRDADLRVLLSRLEELAGPLVVIGDFNTTDQQSLYAPLARRLRDAHRESGWGMGFTFTRWRGVGLPLWRIDYVFHSPDLVALSTTLGDYGGSDHKPVLARLAFDTQE